jgi:hypothetical protein
VAVCQRGGDRALHARRRRRLRRVGAARERLDGDGTERGGSRRGLCQAHLPSVPRFISWQNDVTRPQSSKHSKHARSRTCSSAARRFTSGRKSRPSALRCAIEWPDDELSVFATLRGPFFAVGDEALLEWTHRFV